MIYVNNKASNLTLVYETQLTLLLSFLKSEYMVWFTRSLSWNLWESRVFGDLKGVLLSDKAEKVILLVS
jgi:hypothetical protein